MGPQTRYALSGDVNIAYQVIGEGPVDLVFVMGWVSNIDEFWTEPSFANFLQRLARFSRLIVFDKRGTGLSDRVDEKNLPTLEQRMDDVRAVMDAAGLAQGGAARHLRGRADVRPVRGHLPGAHRRADDVRLFRAAACCARLPVGPHGGSASPVRRGDTRRLGLAARRHRGPRSVRGARRSAFASGGRATSCAARARARCWRSSG